jgi:hypothetical protein
MDVIYCGPAAPFVPDIFQNRSEMFPNLQGKESNPGHDLSEPEISLG